MATIYSQPANTGAGQSRSTQLVTALSALRSERNPVSLDDFAIRHGLEVLLRDEQLRRALLAHEKVIYNVRNNTLAWKPDFDVRTPKDLLNLVQQRYSSATPPQPYGFKLADLRDSYPATREAVDSFSRTRRRTVVSDEEGEPLEETKKILVLPGPRDGSIRQVYFNEASSAAYIAQNDNKLIEPIDEEFKQLWHSLTIPDAVDLPRQLEQEGHMTATAVAHDAAAQAAAAARLRGRGRGRGRGQGRRVRIVNTHLDGVDLSSNYTGGT